MEKLCIDVRGFSVEKKKRVRDAFFKLGFKLPVGHTHVDIHAGWYGNLYSGGDSINELMWGNGGVSKQQLKHAITYTDLMRKAGMDESDPDKTLSAGKQEDLQSEKQAEKAAPKQIGNLTVGVELSTDLQTIISDYMHLLDSIKDPYARGVIKSQITDLTDLQYKQLNGENNNA